MQAAARAGVAAAVAAALLLGRPETSLADVLRQAPSCYSALELFGCFWEELAQPQLAWRALLLTAAMRLCLAEW